MFRVAPFIWPNGDINSIVQHDEKNGPPVSALAFYSRIEGEIEDFKKRIHKSLSSQPKMKGQK